MTMRWLRIAAVALPLLITLGTWMETHYAKAAELDRFKTTLAADLSRLESTVHALATDLKIGQLENRRTLLRGEAFQLKSVRTPTALERRRLDDVETELRDVESRLEQLR